MSEKLLLVYPSMTQFFNAAEAVYKKRVTDDISDLIAETQKDIENSPEILQYIIPLYIMLRSRVVEAGKDWTANCTQQTMEVFHKSLISLGRVEGVLSGMLALREEQKVIEDNLRKFSEKAKDKKVTKKVTKTTRETKSASKVKAKKTSTVKSSKATKSRAKRS